MSSYNYAAFSPDNYDFQSSEGPALGQQAPDFELDTSDGQRQRLLDFPTEFLLLEIGSLTCPLFQSRRGGMAQIVRDFPDVTSAVLYVREAHPGAQIPAHGSMDDKRACATRLSVDLNDPRLILIDDVAGSAHQAFGSMPNAVYVIDKQGIVRFKARWSNPNATRKALQSLQAGQAPSVKSYFKPALPWIVTSTTARAGKGSASDFFKGLPRLLWSVLIKTNLRILLGRD